MYTRVRRRKVAEIKRSTIYRCHVSTTDYLYGNSATHYTRG